MDSEEKQSQAIGKFKVGILLHLTMSCMRFSATLMMWMTLASVQHFFLPDLQ